MEEVLLKQHGLIHRCPILSTTSFKDIVVIALHGLPVDFDLFWELKESQIKEGMSFCGECENNMETWRRYKSGK